MENVPTEASAVAKVSGLEVTGDLFGHEHRFVHDGRTVTVKVPDVEFDDDDEPVGKHRGFTEYRGGWTDDDRLESKRFALGGLHIAITLTEQISIPDEMLLKAPKQFELAGVELSDQLNEQIDDYQQRLYSALVYWEQVVRWISGSSALGTASGRHGRISNERLEWVYLRHQQSKHEFWAPTHVFEAMRATTIDGFIWQQIGNALAAGSQQPLWFRYLDGAYHQFVSRQFNDTVLSLAISCETLAREVFWIRVWGNDKRESKKAYRSNPGDGYLNPLGASDSDQKRRVPC